LAVATPARAGSTPEEKCAAAKMKAVGKKYSAKAKCYAKAFGKSEPVSQDCLGKAEDKFDAAFTKAESHGGCLHVSDVIPLEAKVDQCVADVVGDIGCGNGIIEGDEQCDDGNLVDGDGCDSTCQSGLRPARAGLRGRPDCCSNTCVGGVCVPTPVCGDGITDPPETCDDGNLMSGDGCSAVCQDECNANGQSCAETTTAVRISARWVRAKLRASSPGSLVRPTDSAARTYAWADSAKQVVRAAMGSWAPASSVTTPTR
jgi:cysteine-rich repeat protein